jgi:hypothetical protein
MDFYIYRPESDVYDNLVLENEDDWDRFDQFKGKKLAHSWVPVPIGILKMEKAGDFPSLASHVPVFSERGLHILQPLLANRIECLPLKSRVGKFFAINVLDLVDCLDYSRSEIKRFPSGGIMYIKNYAFKKNVLKGKHMFKVEEAPLKEVLVSSVFKEAVEKNKLQGLIFKKVG